MSADLTTIRFSTGFHCKTSLASKAIHFGEENLYMRGLPNFFLGKPYIGNYFVPNKLILLLSLKGQYHEDFAVLRQFCAKIITLRL